MCLLGERGEEGVVGEKKMCSPLCFSVCSGKTELCDFSVNYPLRGSRRGHNTHNPVGGGGFQFWRSSGPGRKLVLWGQGSRGHSRQAC